MRRTLHWIAATLFAAFSITPALAASTSPVGNWQVTSGEARYTVMSCGGGRQLCAKLTWLRSDARTDENLAQLNRYVVNGAQPAGSNTWSGNVLFNGHRYDGTMKMVSKNFMTLKGCSGVLCHTYEFTRI